MPSPDLPPPTTPAGAFFRENPFASEAQATVDTIGSLAADDPSIPQMVAAAGVSAQLAVAFELRQGRFDAIGIARGEV